MGDYRRGRDSWRDDRAPKRHREDPLACHNCGERGHLAKDCPSTHGKEVKDKVLVKDKRLKPRIIGTGGGVIKGLEQELGCRLRIEDVVKDDPDQGFYVRISGPGLDEVCRAVSRIEKFVLEIEVEQQQLEEKRAQYLAEQKALQERQSAVTTLEGVPPMGLSLQPNVSPHITSTGMQSYQPQGYAAPSNFSNNAANQVVNHGANQEFANAASQQLNYGQSNLNATQGNTFVSNQLQYGSMGPNTGQIANPSSVYNQGMQLKQPALSHQNSPLEENMEMSSPDRKEAFPGGITFPVTDKLPQTTGFNIQNIPLGPFGNTISNGAALSGGFGEVQGLGELLPRTLEELEARNIAEYLELAKAQTFEEDEEINRHRQRMREIQDFFQLRLSNLRLKQGQQREEFLLQESHIKRLQSGGGAENGLVGAQQNFNLAQSLGGSDQPALQNLGAGVGSLGSMRYGAATGQFGESLNRGQTNTLSNPGGLNTRGNAGMGLSSLQAQQYAGYG